MQQEGMNLYLSEAEIKKTLSYRECKIVLCRSSLDESSSFFRGNTDIHHVSEPLDDASNTVKVHRSKRRKISSHMMKGRRFRKMLKGRRKHSHSIIKSIEGTGNDENTTNSENSESSTLLGGINWEENVDIENNLVDEFAPRVPSNLLEEPSTSMLKSSLYCDVQDSIETTSDPMSTSDLALVDDEEIYVQVSDKWLLCKIVEVDLEDQEILVHYLEGPPIQDEWLKSGSKRISKTKPLLHKDLSEDEVQLQDPVNDSYSTEQIQTIIEPNQNLPDKPADNLEPKYVKFRTSSMGTSKKRKSLKKHRPIHSSQNSCSSWIPKFEVGEDVLAKWSDHRMQKFPAKIKSISSDGSYDVLFYDGFEKTIKEDQLYKTTPEDVAKYKKAKPSEADSFVDIEIDSKEARRQRKKKTFDDYVFSKDLIKRRSIKSNHQLTHSKKHSHYSKPELKKTSISNQFSKKRIRRRRRLLSCPKRGEGNKMKLHLLDARRESRHKSSDQEDENFLGFEEVSKQDSNSDIKNLEPAEVKLSPPVIEESKSTDVLGIKPINITGKDGIIRKSVVIPDEQFPENWSKHAVLMPTNTWEIYLLSPDGYQLSSEEDLKRYFSSVPSGGVPPESLNFNVDSEKLPELMVQQKEIPGAGAPKVWFRKKSAHRGSKKGGSRTRIPSQNIKSIGRVRTLLPKNRFECENPPPLPVFPSPQPITPGPEQSVQDIWRCPKGECDKKFRKESLLQMHIKHYHSELSSLVRSVPNMVDIACARSESVNSDWTPSSDSPKTPLNKRVQPKPVIPSPNYSRPQLDDQSAIESAQELNTSSQGSSKIPDQSVTDILATKKQNISGERKSIKTILPVSRLQPVSLKNIDSDNTESEEEYIEQKKNGSRIFKPGRFRKGILEQGSQGTDITADPGFTQMPTFKVTRKRKFSDKLQAYSDNNDSYEEERPLQSEIPPSSDGIVIESMKSEEFINCICGFREEDGLMIQCDICMCWQHGLCSGIENEADVPERYVCQICRNPLRVRRSKKYLYAQHYLTQGKLPTFKFRVRNDEDIKNREMILKRCFELSSSVYELENVHRSLGVKFEIAKTPGHPKLYMWSKNWEEEGKSKFHLDENDESNGGYPTESESQVTGPKPEAPIDLEECRVRLLDHLDHYWSQLEDRLTSLQTQVAALESIDPDLATSNEKEKMNELEKVNKQTIQMLIRDVNTVMQFGAIC